MSQIAVNERVGAEDASLCESATSTGVLERRPACKFSPSSLAYGLLPLDLAWLSHSLPHVCSGASSVPDIWTLEKGTVAPLNAWVTIDSSSLKETEICSNEFDEDTVVAMQPRHERYITFYVMQRLRGEPTPLLDDDELCAVDETE